MVNKMDLCDGRLDGVWHNMLRHPVQEVPIIPLSRTIISSDTGAEFQAVSALSSIASYNQRVITFMHGTYLQELI